MLSAVVSSLLISSVLDMLWRSARKAAELRRTPKRKRATHAGTQISWSHVIRDASPFVRERVG
jgi:hypothetical protein